MSEPNSGEYSVRSLAEILREHGLESELGTRPGRRRKGSDDVEATGRTGRVETGSRAARPQDPAQRPPQAPGVRASAPVRTPGAPAAGRAPTPAAAHPSAPVWTDQPPAGPRPAAGLAGPVTPVREPAPARTPASAPARVPARVESPAPEARPDRSSTTGPVGRTDATSQQVRRDRRKTDSDPALAPADNPVKGRGPTTSAIPSLAAARAKEQHPVTGPIPVQRAGEGTGATAEDAEPLTGRESALAWLRFAGEMVVALAVGIGLYFAFTVLWELMPYVALVAAPIAVTALVAGVTAWRRRQGEGALGMRLHLVLLLAGTVLVIAPAARLLAG